jgi:hypothetical protein
MSYFCEICNKNYKSNTGLWLHNKKYHSNNNQPEKIDINVCRYCKGVYSCKQSRWKHEQKCKIKFDNKNKEEFDKNLAEQVKMLNEKVQILEQKPNITNNNITNNTNIQYVVNAPTASTISHLTFDEQTDILNQGLNSLTCLIEKVNFNKSIPENHSYCVTAINDKHASVIDEKTNTIVKTNKFDLYDNVLTSYLNNLEKLASNSKFTNEQKIKYNEKISYLKNEMYKNNKFIKRYYTDINLISYNNKDMVKETWKNLKQIEQIRKEAENDYYIDDKPRGFDDLIDELPDEEKPNWMKQKNSYNRLVKSVPEDPDSSDSELSSDSDLDSEESETEECNVSEITIKSKQYILDGSNVYCKNSNGTRGELYGTYLNNKVKKIVKPKEFDI